MVVIPFLAPKSFPQPKSDMQKNGGLHPWNPPYFASCFFTAPFLVDNREWIIGNCAARKGTDLASLHEGGGFCKAKDGGSVAVKIGHSPIEE